MRKYVIMGVQGSGKGTQATMLADGPRPRAHRRGGHLPLERAEPHQARRAGPAHHGGGRAGRRRPGRGRGQGPAERARLELRLHHRRVPAQPSGRPSSSWRATTSTGSSTSTCPTARSARRVLARRLCASCGMDYNLIDNSPHVRRPAATPAAESWSPARGRHRGGARGPAAGVPRARPTRCSTSSAARSTSSPWTRGPRPRSSSRQIRKRLGLPPYQGEGRSTAARHGTRRCVRSRSSAAAPTRR